MKKYILSFVGVVALATLLYAESTQIKNTGIGYQIGTSASQHVGFYGAAPVVQQNAAAVTTNVASVAVSLTKASKAASTAVTLTKATMSGNFYDANTQLVSITFITNVTVNVVYGFDSDTGVVLTNGSVNTVYGFNTSAQADAISSTHPRTGRR